MFGWLKKRFGAARTGTALRVVRARYDAAVTNDQNRRHWAAADGLSANAAASPEVRRILRERARHEMANSSLCLGVILTLANDVVGSGARLQMLTPDADANRLVEREFMRWAAAVNLPEKLRTMRISQAASGEAFGILTDNPHLDTPVQLDLNLVEADQVTDPTPHLFQPNTVDGIVFDSFGNPVEYHVLREHPGNRFSFSMQFDRVPARSMLHLYRCDRPGQSRGVPDITPALPLFAQLRRFTLATLGAAEMAATPGGVLYTDAPANGEADQVSPMDLIELERGMLLTMPGGWKLGQVKSEHPSTTYAEFKREIINEIARCLNMPLNIALANSAGYNYASGRLDHQTYFKSVRVDQSRLAHQVLDRLFRAWLDEAVLIEGYPPGALRTIGADLSHTWFFDGHEHVDPAKEANAQSVRLAAHTTTLADEYARRGLDWETQLRQRAKELELMRNLGLDPAESPIPSDQAQHEDSTDVSPAEQAA